MHRPRYDDWSFPKGKLQRGEHLLRAVLREVEEETGIVARLGRRLSSSHYVTGGRPKRVDYWAATPAAEAREQAGPETYDFVPNDEVDRMVWLPPDEAARALSYDRDRVVLDEFVRGPAGTVPLILLRHAPAGDKRAWAGDDVLRPLDERGRADAGELADLLACFGPVRLVCSATARCVETVLPLAHSLAAEVVTDHAFTIGDTSITPSRPEAEASVSAVLRRLHQLLDEGGPLLVCTHGELVPAIVGGLCERFGAKPPGEPMLEKSAFWVLHRHGNTLTAAEHHTP